MKKRILLFNFFCLVFNFSDAQYFTAELAYNRNFMLNTAKFKYTGKPANGYCMGLSYYLETNKLYQTIGFYYNGYLSKTDSADINVFYDNGLLTQTTDTACKVNTSGFDLGFRHNYGIILPANPFLSIYGGYSLSFTRIKFGYSLPANTRLNTPDPDESADDIHTRKAFVLGINAGIKYDFNKFLADITLGGKGRVSGGNDSGVTSFPSLHLYFLAGIVIPLNKKEK